MSNLYAMRLSAKLLPAQYNVEQRLRFVIGIDSHFYPQLRRLYRRRIQEWRVVLYARISTDGQTTDNQLRELRAAAARQGRKVAEEFVTMASAAPRAAGIAHN